MNNSVSKPILRFKHENGSQVLYTPIELFTQKISNLLNDNNRYEVLSRINPNTEKVDIFLSKLSKINIISFDIFIIKEVCAFLKKYPSLDIKLHINIAPDTLVLKDFPDMFMKICQEQEFDKFLKLKFEILENWSFTKEQIYIVNQNIKFLNSLWIKIWIDDYPNQNNNNELLWQIKWISFVKIDKWIIWDYLNWKITKIELLNWMGNLINQIDKYSRDSIDIIIEWVENKEILLMLQNDFWHRIQFFQWFYFDYPNCIYNLTK